jgi:pimeloyl-ACP methyl ester carboxylesterase
MTETGDYIRIDNDTGSFIYPSSRPFFDIAEYLSQRGFAVLQYDKRGIGANATILDYNVWGNVTFDNLARDAQKALDVLLQQPEVDSSKIVLVDHSEGTTIVPRIAINNSDKVDVIVLMGTLAQNLYEIGYSQVMVPVLYGWARLKADPEQHLRTFCEEVVRLESPVQGLFRWAARDFELHGVTIPQGAMLNVRYAAANRDEREFEQADVLNLEREKAGRHLGFGSGVHHCLGAPLARREMYWTFKALIDRVDDMWFAPGRNDFRVAPNFALRALKELHIEFKPR